MLYGMATSAVASAKACGKAIWYCKASLAVGGAKAAVKAVTSATTIMLGARVTRPSESATLADGAATRHRSSAWVPSAIPTVKTKTAVSVVYSPARPSRNHTSDHRPAP